MTRLNFITVIFYVFILSTEGSGQGRVDSDRILFNIEQTTRKIDRDSLLSRSIAQQEKVILFFKDGSLQKLVTLTKIEAGTEMSTCYFTNKPILIKVERNNFRLTDTSDMMRAVKSFTSIVDTVNNSSTYTNLFNVSYYFHDDMVRYAVAVMYSKNGDVKNIRRDDKSDIAEGMRRYNLAKEHLELGK